MIPAVILGLAVRRSRTTPNGHRPQHRFSGRQASIVGDRQEPWLRDSPTVKSEKLVSATNLGQLELMLKQREVLRGRVFLDILTDAAQRRADRNKVTQHQ